MKKTLVVLAFALAVAISATAQENLNFADLPPVSSPVPIPNGYGQLNWQNIYYVDPEKWPGAGPGYKDELIEGKPSTQDVAFVGGKVCRQLQQACFGTVSSPPGGSTGFLAASANVAGGFGPTYVIVTAYNNGRYVGSVSSPLGTQLQILNFPASWGIITQLVLQTDAPDDLVLYDLQVYLVIIDPPPPSH